MLYIPHTKSDTCFMVATQAKFVFLQKQTEENQALRVYTAG